MTQYHVYAIGNALVDTEIEIADSDLARFAIDKGVMTLVDEQRQNELVDLLSDHLIASKRASGGSACNTVIAASYFGAKSFYSCKVANDENGDFYLNDLRNAGVDHNPNAAGNGITGKCLALVTPDAERTLNSFLGISETVSQEELSSDAIAQSHYVYLEGYLVTSPTGRAAAIELRKQAKANGTKTAMSLSDPAMVQFFRDGLLDMVGDGVDLLFCNEAEAMGFTETTSLEGAIEALKNYSSQFAITCGARGAIVFDGQSQSRIAPHPVKAIDTNGAGDMFAGAFLFAITQGYSFQKAGELASLASATVVSQFGPRLRPEQHAEIKKVVLNT